MKLSVIKDREPETVNKIDVVQDLVLNLQAESFLLRIQEDYGERCSDYSDEVRQIAYENVRRYQEKHIAELAKECLTA